MKTIIYQLTAPQSLVRVEQDLDDGQPGECELLAETEFTVISPGTELAAWNGKPPLRPVQLYPRLVGYCNVARVLKVGDRVTDIGPGDYVLTHQSHRSHFRCHRSDVLLHARDLPPDGRQKLATTYLYHLGYASLLAGGFVPGHEVAIVGLGALGLTSASLVLAFGGEPLVLTGSRADQVPSCLAGAHVLPKAVPGPGEWPSSGGMDGVDLVINTSDAWSDFRLGLQLARRGGVVVLLGFPGRGEPPPDFNPLESQYLYDKQLAVKQAGHVSRADVAPIDVRFTQARNMQYLFRLIQRGSLDPSPLISLRVPSRDLGDAYAALTARKAGAYSALVDWTS